MYKHHEQAIENLITHFKDDDEVIAIILGGSVAKGIERVDSDIDAMVVVTQGRYDSLAAQNRLCECISENCPYEGGYFDLKYYTKDFLQAVSQKGSEPARNAFLKSRCIYTKDSEIHEIVAKIPVFQLNESEDKMLSFYSALVLSAGYFWSMSNDNLYLRIRSATDIVYYGFRLLLQEAQILFPCHKSIEIAINSMTNNPDAIMEKSHRLLTKLDNESKEDFVKTICDFISYKPPEDDSEILTRYVADNEKWWLNGRPVITEW